MCVEQISKHSTNMNSSIYKLIDLKLCYGNHIIRNCISEGPRPASFPFWTPVISGQKMGILTIVVSTPECQQAKGIRTLHPGGFVKAKTFPAYRINAILYRNYVQRYVLESVSDLSLTLDI